MKFLKDKPFSHKKKLGQNFLIDDVVIDNIVSAISPNLNEHLVEIGPGPGAITKPVLKKAQHLTAIELDTRLIPHLTQLKQFGDLNIINANALKFDFNTLLKSKDDKLRVFGNLPYNISTPLLFHILDYKDKTIDMHFMLQLEVAQRAASLPGSKSFGVLSIMLQYACQVTLLFPISAKSFNPKPKVESAFIRLTPYTNETSPYPHTDITLLKTIVTKAFTQRRKTLKNALKEISQDTFKELDIDANLRPEQLSIETFVKITNYVKAHGLT